ncbi:MAG: hypothetical protein ACOC1S_04045 [bacterium]
MNSELKEKICKLEGVISCKITYQQDNKIDEIHAIANNGRSPKRIVRDLETLVLVECDQEIDHKKISIARISQKQRDNQEERIKIISIYREHNTKNCVFRLKCGSEKIEEKVAGSASDSLPFAVGRGMINVLQKYIDFAANISLENIFRTGINDEVLIVQLTLNNQYKSKERLLGSVFVENDLPLAVGKAILNALNRRIPRLES